MSNDINELREHLFDSLRAIKTGGEKEIERAKAISDVAQVIINSAKVEVDYVRATGKPAQSGFLQIAPGTPAKTASMADLQPSITHRLK